MGRRSPGYAWICCPLVIASYSSGCFSGNLDWSSSVAAQQFDVSGAFGKCTKEHVKECPSRCDTSPCKRLVVRTQFLTVSAHRRYFCNVTLQWSWRVYLCDSTAVVGSCPGVQLLLAGLGLRDCPGWALMTSCGWQNYNGPSASAGIRAAATRRPGRAPHNLTLEWIAQPFQWTCSGRDPAQIRRRCCLDGSIAGLRRTQVCSYRQCMRAAAHI
jgi:hypothetical protein